MIKEEFKAEEKALLEYANGHPFVLSLLYDIDMMPEQILALEAGGRNSREWLKMLHIIQALQRAKGDNLGECIHHGT